MKQQMKTEKSISNRLSEILPQLSKDQLRYVAVANDFKTKGEAAEAIGMKKDTIYRWPEIVQEAVELIALDVVLSAREIRKRSLIKAMMVKVAGLDIDDDAIRQKVATEIIEGELGKPTQRQELTAAEGKDLIPRITDAEYNRTISSLAAAASVRKGLSDEGAEQNSDVDTSE